MIHQDILAAQARERSGTLQAEAEAEAARRAGQTRRNRIQRDRGLSRAKPSASSGASVLRTCLISTADPSRSTTGVPSAAGRGGPPGRGLRPGSQDSSRRSGVVRVPDARPGWRCLRACPARRAASASAWRVADRSRASAAKIS